MPDAKKPAIPGAKAAPKKSQLPGQPGEQPGDEWGDDNPGNVHGLGVDDEAFFHRDGAGPVSGRVVCHGVHGATIESGGQHHKVLWGRVLGLKKRAVREGKVVEQGEAGAIVEHKDGRRVFVAGDLGLPQDTPRLRDVAGLEDAGRTRKAPKISDLEEFARQAGEQDLAKADHDCEGPALCRVCHARDAEAVLAKSAPPAGLDVLETLVRRFPRGPRSVIRR